MAREAIMSINWNIALLIVSGVFVNSIGNAAEDNCCDRENGDCQEDQEYSCAQENPRYIYNPLCRYYPYRTIFQDSYVHDESNDGVSSWPSRRDGNFSDALTR